MRDSAEALRPLDLTVDVVRTRGFQGGESGAHEAIVFVHGNPGSSEDWRDLATAAARIGRVVAVDMPGFGQADKPAKFDHSPAGYARFLSKLLSQLGIDQVHLVLHDFGGPWGLAWATENPTSVRSLALFNVGVPLGYRWHSTAKLVRTPVLGEFLMAATTRKSFEGIMRRGGGTLPAGAIDRAWANFTPPTRRAAMKAYRSVADPATVGDTQAALLTAYRLPALVFWGEQDGFVPVEVAERQREVFDPIEIVRLPKAGHWAFLEEPALAEARLVGFLEQQVNARR
ncbi:MAG TPA: alpha/beta hydrolase [Candidatus Dormibacteraeota bacterium]|jgi:pimeloyl-ACP methyl ester carboxylesterase